MTWRRDAFCHATHSPQLALTLMLTLHFVLHAAQRGVVALSWLLDEFSGSGLPWALLGFWHFQLVRPIALQISFVVASTSWSLLRASHAAVSTWSSVMYLLFTLFEDCSAIFLRSLLHSFSLYCAPLWTPVFLLWRKYSFL